jgi:hypothetical protein
MPLAITGIDDVESNFGTPYGVYRYIQTFKTSFYGYREYIIIQNIIYTWFSILQIKFPFS